jgi:hypothetical protein
MTNGEIDRVFLNLDTSLRKLKMEIGIEVKRRVEERTPVGKSGRLKKGWGFTPKARDIEVYNIVEYASFVEMGTDKMEPRGMLRTTIAEMDQIVEVAKKKAGVKG